MITHKEALARFGDPKLERHMRRLTVPHHISEGIAALPRAIYCNDQMIGPLIAAFENIIKSGQAQHLKTWDGCFNIRPMKGSLTRAPSLHSWGLAIDINAAWNRQGQQPTLPPELVKCFKDAGFDWGGDWKGRSVDGMHFQLARIK
jgi:hypothetical protein